MDVFSFFIPARGSECNVSVFRNRSFSAIVCSYSSPNHASVNVSAGVLKVLKKLSWAKCWLTWRSVVTFTAPSAQFAVPRIEPPYVLRPNDNKRNLWLTQILAKRNRRYIRTLEMCRTERRLHFECFLFTGRVHIDLLHCQCACFSSAVKSWKELKGTKEPLFGFIWTIITATQHTVLFISQTQKTLRVSALTPVWIMFPYLFRRCSRTIGWAERMTHWLPSFRDKSKWRSVNGNHNCDWSLMYSCLVNDGAITLTNLLIGILLLPCT